MDGSKVHGLRIFLITLLEMLEEGLHISCEEVEAGIADGIANMLLKKYSTYFERNGFSADSADNVDKYYSEVVGCAESEEERKYACDKQAGLSLLIKLALNDIY